MLDIIQSFASKVIYSPSFDVNISTSKAASSDAADFRCKAVIQYTLPVRLFSGCSASYFCGYHLSALSFLPFPLSSFLICLNQALCPRFLPVSAARGQMPWGL